MEPESTFARWVVGLLGVSLILGSLITWLVWDGLDKSFRKLDTKRNWNVPEEEIENVPFQPFIIGIIERTFFTILIAFNVPGVAGGIFAWIAVKMLSGWNRMTANSATWRRVLSFNALICNLISLLFAVLGGLIAAGKIPIK